MIEQQLEALTNAINGLTNALTQVVNVPDAPAQQVVQGNVQQQPQQQAPVQHAQQVPAQNAAAPATQGAAAQNVVGYPSEQPALTFEQIQQEITSAYQASNGDPRIMEIVQRYGGALSTIPPEHYAALLQEVRAL